MISRERIFDLLKHCDVVLIGSVDENGFPNQKAMLPPRKIDGNRLYFTTNTGSMRVEQYQTNDKASVYFYKKGKFKYEGAMLIGTMSVLTDEKIKKEIWRLGDSVFYKKGVTDPDYCVVCFTAEKCRYYADLRTQWVEL